MKTAVLMIIFNRPELTKRVFSAVNDACPEKLFIAADGPRARNDEDLLKCAETREVVSKAGWKCELKTYFRKQNVGCDLNVVSAVDWFLKDVECGIILEDDCLPGADFFRFCDELLERFGKEKKVFNISGSNCQYGRKRGDASYYFSKYAHTHGWATWRRAWEGFKFDFSENHKQWDLQWREYVMKSGVSIIPNVNLVKNIGFEHPDALHKGKAARSEYIKGDVDIVRLQFPLAHPEKIKKDIIADTFLMYGSLWGGFSRPGNLMVENAFLAALSLLPNFVNNILRMFWRKVLKKYFGES